MGKSIYRGAPIHVAEYNLQRIGVLDAIPGGPLGGVLAGGGGVGGCLGGSTAGRRQVTRGRSRGHPGLFPLHLAAQKAASRCCLPPNPSSWQPVSVPFSCDARVPATTACSGPPSVAFEGILTSRALPTPSHSPRDRSPGPTVALGGERRFPPRRFGSAAVGCRSRLLTAPGPSTPPTPAYPPSHTTASASSPAPPPPGLLSTATGTPLHRHRDSSPPAPHPPAAAASPPTQRPPALRPSGQPLHRVTLPSRNLGAVWPPCANKYLGEKFS
jgi:hypothetical protein